MSRSSFYTYKYWLEARPNLLAPVEGWGVCLIDVLPILSFFGGVDELMDTEVIYNGLNYS